VIRKLGANCTGFDSFFGKRSSDPARRKPYVKIVDLSTAAGQAIIWALLHPGSIIFVLLAPPCGTCSRARERPLPPHLASTMYTPPALRSDERPEGLENLTGLDKTRVEQSNVLFKFAAEICFFCLSHDLYFVLENPLRSIMWLLPQMVAFASMPPVSPTDYSACEHGGSRNKRQRLRSN
jgi:hypothetical protein